MTRKFITGIAAAAALAVAGFASAVATSAPAEAQSWSITVGGGHHWRGDDWGGRGGHRHHREHWRGDRFGQGGWGDRGWGDRGWGDRGWGDHGWRRPVRPVYGFGHDYGARCSVRTVRYWDGFGWAVEKRRFCR